MNRETDVLVVGGGATGVGVARDLGLRGVETVVVERNGLTGGATGNTHGVLHSGARYATSDPESARECIAENEVLREVAPHCIDPTGGFFAQLPEDDDGYFERLRNRCRDCGIDTEPVDVESVRRDRPYLSPETERLLRVPDAVVHPFPLAVANAVDVREHGGAVHTDAEVVDLLVDGGEVTGAEIRRPGATGTETVRADHVVNATGAWAGEVGSLADVEIPMRPSKGAMVVVDYPPVDAVVNRARPATDGDIVVPHDSTAVLGTTSEAVDDPDEYPKEEWEVDLLVETAGKMVPDLQTAPVVRSYWGVRPLFGGEASEFEAGRSVTRGYTLLDHGERDGVSGFTTIVGGKLTTYRLMAESVADHVCERLGVDAPCRTAAEPLPGRDDPDALRSALSEFGPLPPAEERPSDARRD